MEEIRLWWDENPEFVFLLALPFLVAAVAFLAEAVRGWWRRAKGRLHSDQ